MKKAIVFVRSAPYGVATSAEAFRAIIGIAAMGIHTDVIFADDGIYVGMKNQKPEDIGMKNIGAFYSNLKEYDVKAYFLSECLALRDLDKDDILFGEVIDRSTLKDMIDSSDVVLQFT